MNSALVVFASAFQIFWVDPYGDKPYLPDADPAGGIVTNALGGAAAKGEIEAVSFVVNPSEDLKKVDFVPGDLKGPGGAAIPASAIDFSLVKVWFRPGGRWNSSWAAGQSNPQLISTCVIHDDALIKVDFKAKKNYLRASYPEGDRYLDISHRDKQTVFKDDLEPIVDAPKFVPMDLKKDFRQQFWVTVKVPADAKPGLYRGDIAVSAAGAPLMRIPLSFEIYPFALPEPRTHYDTSKPYVSMWMGSPTIERLLQGSHDLAMAERKCRALFRSMKEHNAVNLTGIGDIKRDSTDDPAIRTLIIARQEGLTARGLINGAAFGDGGFVWSPGAPPKDFDKDVELYKKSKADFTRRITLQRDVMDKYLGHHDCYFNSVDECGVGTNRRSFGYWAIIKAMGMKVWTDYSYPYQMGFIVDMNDVPAGIDHVTAYQWRCSGAKTVTYAGPFTGPDNPDIWRRVKGMRDWYSDYDGLHEYNFWEGSNNRWNDFVYYGRYCQFGMVYRTRDGLVTTLAWEGVREAFDDVKYFTLLRRRAEAAMASKDPETVKLGRAALHWQDSVDPEYVPDLDRHRRETAQWILKLIAKVGPQPADPDTELPPPELPACTVGAKIPSAVADLQADAAKYMGMNRYDLAIRNHLLVLKSKDAANADKVKSTLALRELYTATYRRADAIAAVEAQLPARENSKGDCGRLLLAKVNAMMTDCQFEEEYTKQQLDAAAEVIVKALKYPGVSEDDRYAAIQRMVDGYVSGGAYQAAIDYAAARMGTSSVKGDTKLDDGHRCWISISVAAAWKGLAAKAEGDEAKELWKKACKAFDEARRYHNNDNDKNFLRQICDAEAQAAEKCEDWVRAQKCYAQLVPCYDEESKDLKNRASANLIRVTKMVSKTQKIDPGSMDDDGEGISLDE